MKIAQKLAITYTRIRLNLVAAVSRRKAAEKAFELFCTPHHKSNREGSAVFGEGEKISFELEGNIVKGFRWNYPQLKKALIIHGFESSVLNFDRYIMPLVKKGYEIIAFDAPAHGRSGGKQINLPLYIRMLQQIDATFGPINSFLAHSFGGLALAHFLETIPQRPGIKAVLIAPATETTTAIDSFFHLLRLNNGVRSEFDKIIFERSGVRPSHFSIRRAMNNIHANILWIHDEGDDLTPLKDVLGVQADNHAHIEFVITTGLGHRRIYRDNNVVKRIIDSCRWII